VGVVRFFLIAVLFAFFSASALATAPATGQPITVNLSVRVPSSGDPAVKIALVNNGDDDYGLHPVQWLLGERLGVSGKRFVIPLVLASNIPRF
jgi:hypothetical protein